MGILLAGSAFAAPRPEPLLVSAAISLKAPLEKLAPAFEKHTGFGVKLNFGASGSLQHQIEQGAPVDVFVSAAEAPVESLEARGLIKKDTRKDIAGNSLVLVVRAAEKSPIATLEELRETKVRRIALGEPKTVPAGKYAQEALAHAGLLPDIEKKLVYGNNARQTLTYVETGDAQAGIVYATDALESEKVNVVRRIDSRSHGPIVYPAVVTAKTKRDKAARAFVDYLAGPKGRRALKTYGFVVEEPAG